MQIYETHITAVFSDIFRKATQVMADEITYKKISEIIHTSGPNEKQVFEKI